MIEKAITTIIKTISPRVYSPEVNSDKMPTRPFYVFTNTLTDTIKDKEGIAAYEWQTVVTVVTDTAESNGTASQAVVDALTAKDETVVNDTKISEVSYEDETGRELDDLTLKHVNQITFQIITETR